MLEIVLFSLAFLILAIATYTDIRTREVPDWLNFSGIIAGLGIRSIWSAINSDWSIIGWGLLGFGVFFSIGIIMYYTGQWGGGDSKLLMALGALLGLKFASDNFAVIFLIWILLAGAGYGMLSSLWLAIRNWKKFSKQFIALARVFRKFHLPVLGVFLLGFAFAIASDDYLFRTFALIIAFVVPVLFYLSLTVKAVEKACMYKKVSPKNLTEGDWIAKPVFVKGKYITGPKDLGISTAKIQLLRRLRVKEILIKEGIPFVPSFMIAFLLALWLGNPLAWFL